MGVSDPEVESSPVSDADESPVAALETPGPEGDSPADTLLDALLDVSLGDDDPDAPEDEPVVSAAATPGEVATTTPIPKATANAPTRPT